MMYGECLIMHSFGINTHNVNVNEHSSHTVILLLHSQVSSYLTALWSLRYASRAHGGVTSFQYVTSSNSCFHRLVSVFILPKLSLLRIIQCICSFRTVFYLRLVFHSDIMHKVSVLLFHSSNVHPATDTSQRHVNQSSNYNHSMLWTLLLKHFRTRTFRYKHSYGDGRN